MKIPELVFDIPEMNFSHFQNQINHQAERLKAIIKKTGKNSMSFKIIRNQLIDRVKRRENHLEKYISNSLTIRALTDLWLNEAFNLRCSVTIPLMESIFAIRKYPGTISFLQLVRLFFVRFDKCGDLNALIKGIHETFEQIGKKKLSKDLSTVAEYYKILISIDGPNWVVDQAIEKKVDLDTLQKQMGLSYYFSGRFGDICKYHYYLRQLKELTPNQSSTIFSEIKKKDVYTAPFKEGRFLGHEILSILIDKAPEAELSREWQDIILEIAGDPRVPKNSPKYQKWWALLGPKRIQKVQGWLSGFDLLLFLEVLENFGVSSGKTDLQRMFPARKRFLEGLHKRKLIHGSRLFVSSSADRYLYQHYKKSELPQYAICRGNISVIYLNIQGHHMIEGSHNFSLRIYDTLPESSSILDYGKDSFFQRELGLGLTEEYDRQTNNSSFPIIIRHMPMAQSWQHKAIKAFEELNIKIDPESVFSKEDYQEYKQRYGLMY
jgi:hypothetical protein